MIAEYGVKKFDGRNKFNLWRVLVKALFCLATMEVKEKAEITDRGVATLVDDSTWY